MVQVMVVPAAIDPGPPLVIVMRSNDEEGMLPETVPAGHGDRAKAGAAATAEMTGIDHTAERAKARRLGPRCRAESVTPGSRTREFMFVATA